MEAPPTTRTDQLIALAFPALAVIGVGYCIWRSRGNNFIILPEDVKVHIVETEAQCDDAIAAIDVSGEKILGFDLEWGHGGGKKMHPVSLVQLAGAKDVWLIRMNVIGKMPASLAKLLENRSVLKAGVAILGDARRLLTDWSAMTFGCVELQALAVRYEVNTHGTSLSSLCFTVLGARLNKSHYLTCSNWDQPVLSERQVMYAALDAWVGREIVVRVRVHTRSIPKLIFSLSFWQILSSLKT